MNNPSRYTDPSGHVATTDSNEAGCSFKGLSCIFKDYYDNTDNDELRDRAIYNYVRYHPEYSITADPTLNGPQAFMATAAVNRNEILDKYDNNEPISFATILAFFTSAAFGSIPAGPRIIQPAKSAPPQYGHDPADPDCVGCGYSTSGSQNTQWQFGSNHSNQQWQNKMAQRGWTPEQITEALNSGESYPAVNRVNPDNPATRYVNPETGRSVVIDNVTHEIIHIGGDGYGY